MRIGVSALATKWLNRIAQGFSPGSARKKIALQGGPKVNRMGVCLVLSNPLKSLDCRCGHACTQNLFGRPFRADPIGLHTLG